MDPKANGREGDEEDTYSSYDYENEDIEESIQLLNKHIGRLQTVKEDVYALNAQQQILIQLSKQLRVRFPNDNNNNATLAVVTEEINRLLNTIDSKMQRQSEYYKRHYAGMDRAGSTMHLAPMIMNHGTSSASSSANSSAHPSPSHTPSTRSLAQGNNGEEKENNSGTLRQRVTIVVDEEAEARKDNNNNNNKTRVSASTRSLSERELKPLKGTLVVKVLEARDLFVKNCNPYCVVSLGGSTGALSPSGTTLTPNAPLQARTRVIRRSHHPKWENEEFTFQIERDNANELIFDVWDTHSLRADKRLGSAKISLWVLLEKKKFDMWVKLIPAREKDEGRVSGDLHVSLHFYPRIEEHPLFAAIRQSDLAKVEKLLEDPAMDINVKDEHGFTPLHEACVLFTENDDEILEHLLQNPKIDVNVANDDQNTPLHYFCGKYRSPRCSEAFTMFIEKGADVNAQNRKGETPLHKALSNNSLRQMMVTLLIRAGAEVNKVNTLNETPLHAAIISKREDLISQLIKAGADLTLKGSREDVTPCELAKQVGLDQIAEMIRKTQELYDWLDQLGLGQYKLPFIREEIYKDVLVDLNTKTLDRLGVTSTEHRSKFQDEIHHLKQEIAVRNSPKIDVLSKTTEISESQKMDLFDTFNKMMEMKDSTTWDIKPAELEFISKLGDGTSGVVFRGRYKDAEVAIKVMKNHSARDINEFKQEFQMMSTIQNPHVMFFFGACLSPKLCMVLELCGRGSLYHVMNDALLDFGWEQFFNFSIESLKGIHYLHEHGILHRDLKSLNLMITDQWHLKVADFGTARFDTSSMNNTLVQVRGTYWYTAPELYFAERYTTKSDVFSMCVVMWEMIVRVIRQRYERPYSEHPKIKQPTHALIQVSKNGVRCTVPPTCNTELADLIRAGWEHEPTKRPTCQEMLEKLEKLYENYKENKATWDAAVVGDVVAASDNNNNNNNNNNNK